MEDSLIQIVRGTYLRNIVRKIKNDREFLSEKWNFKIGNSATSFRKNFIVEKRRFVSTFKSKEAAIFQTNDALI